MHLLYVQVWCFDWEIPGVNNVGVAAEAIQAVIDVNDIKRIGSEMRMNAPGILSNVVIGHQAGDSFPLHCEELYMEAAKI